MASWGIMVDVRRLSRFAACCASSRAVAHIPPPSRTMGRSWPRANTQESCIKQRALKCAASLTRKACARALHVWQLYVWGRGNEGQLGLGDYRPRTVPALVKALGEQSAGTSVLQVACGASHTLAHA